jgi:hypothetical protein
MISIFTLISHVLIIYHQNLVYIFENDIGFPNFLLPRIENGLEYYLMLAGEMVNLKYLLIINLKEMIRYNSLYIKKLKL